MIKLGEIRLVGHHRTCSITVGIGESEPELLMPQIVITLSQDCPDEYVDQKIMLAGKKVDAETLNQIGCMFINASTALSKSVEDRK